MNSIVKAALVKESPSGILYAQIPQNPVGLLTELFDRLRVDIIIHPNERDKNKNAFSIIRDSNGRYATTPVAELVEVVPDKIVFCHPGGFLLVVRPPFSIK